MSGVAREANGASDEMLIAVLLFGLASLVILSTTGGSIAVSMTGMTVTVNTPK
jgi:hypothetical protein